MQPRPPAATPQTAELPTTNGPWAQGDGLWLAEGAGASLLHLDQVQVHPTGLVDPADPASGTKVGGQGQGRRAGGRGLGLHMRTWLPACRTHVLTLPNAVLPACPQFLAPEKLRGVGGILLNSQGQRFVDELSTRDRVAQVGHARSRVGRAPWPS